VLLRAPENMTIYEHAMVGINGALAAGLQRRHGWQIVAQAGVAAMLPDCDGLSILLGPHYYAEAHRLWAHNLLVTGLLAAIVSAAAYRWDVLTKIQRRLAKHWAMFSIGGAPAEKSPHCAGELCLWLAVGVLAAYSHLAMDILFSAGKNLGTWGLAIFWPFSNDSYAYPLVPWGDIGATVILAVGMFAMVRWPKRIRAIAAGSLLAVAVYIVVRGFFFC
jgi:membrane-bound metal-dependent hydrolase YbcI (DUF457 family)